MKQSRTVSPASEKALMKNSTSARGYGAECEPWLDSVLHSITLARARQSCVPARLVLRSEEHTSELQSLRHLVCRLLLEKENRYFQRRVARYPQHKTADRITIKLELLPGLERAERRSLFSVPLAGYRICPFFFLK